jgi:hypothetical protein
VITTSPTPLVADRERVRCRNETYGAVASSLADAEVVDLATFVDGHQDSGDDMFKDLIHLSLSGSRLASDWLLAELGPLENRR